jgi:hypothetical protein
MMQVTKRTAIIFLTFWLFICQTGLAWTVSTCLFTGQKKLEIGKSIKCCKMPSIYNRGGFSTKISKKSCCKIEQHVLKLSTAFEKKNVEKKIFQSFVKKIIFFEIFFSKKIFSDQILGVVQKKLLPSSLKFRLSFLQIFRI